MWSERVSSVSVAGLSVAWVFLSPECLGLWAGTQGTARWDRCRRWGWVFSRLCLQN